MEQLDLCRRRGDRDMLASVVLGVVGAVGMVAIVGMAVVCQFSTVTVHVDHPYGHFHLALRKKK